MDTPRQQPTNYEHLLQLAEEAFAMHSDPGQLQVDVHKLEHLRQLHPARPGGARSERSLG